MTWNSQFCYFDFQLIQKCQKLSFSTVSNPETLLSWPNLNYAFETATRISNGGEVFPTNCTRHSEPSSKSSSAIIVPYRNMGINTNIKPDINTENKNKSNEISSRDEHLRKFLQHVQKFVLNYLNLVIFLFFIIKFCKKMNFLNFWYGSENVQKWPNFGAGRNFLNSL